MTVEEKSVKISELKEGEKFRLIGKSEVYELDKHDSFWSRCGAYLHDPEDKSGWDWEYHYFSYETDVFRVRGA